MARRERRIGGAPRSAERLIALFVAAFLLFNYPLVSLFSRDAAVLGLPLVYVYLFGVWAVVIALTGWIVARSPRS